MKLDKAIETLEDDLRGLFGYLHKDYEDALKLGIEALKLYKALKATGGVPKRFSGIGETKE